MWRSNAQPILPPDAARSSRAAPVNSDVGPHKIEELSVKFHWVGRGTALRRQGRIEKNHGGPIQNAARAESAAQDGSGNENGRFFSEARLVGFFEATLACRIAVGRFRVGIRPLAEQGAQPDAGKRCASSCRSSGAG